jgi:Tfp pilus assembly protein PilX
MQITFRPARPGNKGYALLITLIFLGVMLMVFATMMYWISSNARITTRNNLFNMSEAAAEAAAETSIAQMDRDFLYQSLQNPSVYTTFIPSTNNWPVQFQFSDTNGTANQITVVISPLNWSTNWAALNSAEFTGLNADLAQCQVIATATPLNQGYSLSATVNEQFQLAAIPVFQFGVFYNMDMDFSPGQPLTMNGKVKVNGNIWMCPGALTTFNDNVSASLVITNADDPDDQQGLTFNSSYLVYNADYKSHDDSLTMPVTGANNSQTNVETILNLPPTGLAAPNAAAYYTSNQVYLYNEADLIISNSISGTNTLGGGPLPKGTNLTIFFQDPSFSGIATGYLTPITNDFYWYTNRSLHQALYTNYISPSQVTNILYASYSFVTNAAFKDWREVDTVQAVQIDVGKFNNWLTNGVGTNWSNQCFQDKGHGIDSIYVYNSVPLTSTILPAVRLLNGQQLPYTHGTGTYASYHTAGLTIATPMPIYVWGDYNVTTNGVNFSKGTTNTIYNTRPAGLMGDAVTILSDGWTSSTDNGSEDPSTSSDTTVNAACLEGIVQSTKVGSTKHYSGGLENFLRLLETWNSTLTYNGSIVVMFPSIYATNFWIQPGTYYNPPTRNWGFDANFSRGQSYLPPLTPQVKAVLRGTWGNYTGN